MTDKTKPNLIQTLPQAVADRIAAGEVVERPAAVIKELIENSLDAEANKISVVIEDAGRTLMRIIDNGCGMTEAGLSAAIGRHSTSKLRRFEDLESLTTFGFRGEALPSISAVCRLEIISRTADQEIGSRMKIDGGRVESCEPFACQVGTTISVSHLFYNVPARRKFLRKDPTEFKWIASVFKNFALVFPEVNWELYRGKEKLYDLPAGGEQERLSALFGDDVAEDMIRIDYSRDWLSVRGWISPADLTQRTSSDQYLFLNRRPIKSPRLNRAVYMASEPYYTSGGHPMYVIRLEADPAQFDINVHPAKKDVKFADERGAYSGLLAAVRNAISVSRAPRDMNAGVDRSTESRPIRSERIPVEAPSHLRPYKPISEPQQFRKQPALPFSGSNRKPDIMRVEEPGSQSDSGDVRIRDISHPEVSEEGPTIWQIFDTYLVSPLKTGVVFIDQHVAHERILFERALSAMEQEPWSSQQLLFPVSFAVSPEDVDLVDECLPLLRSMGFEVQQSGPREFRVYSVPNGVRIASERDMLLGIIEEYKDSVSFSNDPRRRLAASFACRGAVKAGQPLEPEEMQRLIDDLFRCEDPEFCPHGRPIYHVLPKRDIEKWFRR